MEESIEDLTKKKDEFQKKANELRKKRDELHTKSKRSADERDELNQRVREIRNKIGNHKKTRDELNERVKYAKEERNDIIKSHIDVKKKIKDLERNRSLNSGVNLNELKQTLRKLENEQMTQPMSSQKEKKMIETIADIHMKIKEQEDLLKKDPKLKEAVEEEKILRNKIEKQHELMAKLAKGAQEEHESMIELIGSIDNLIKKANERHGAIVTCKIEADKVHKEFIDHVNTIHDLERKISGVEKEKNKEKKQADVTIAQKEANEVFERFKRGDKLSTDDLMILQKAGLI